MQANIDLSALKRLSKIELFLLLCGTITVSCAIPSMRTHAEARMPPSIAGTEPAAPATPDC